MSNVENKLYPEVSAGGYCRVDHRMEYIVRAMFRQVNALLNSEMTVLEYGAGHGKWQNDPVILRRNLGNFVGRCAKVVACDVDPAVQRNPQADVLLLLEPSGRLPVADASFDLISAFSVFEHVEDAESVAAELTRVLKPGGWICAWTPRRSVGAEALAQSCVELGWRHREEENSFIPVYRMNTRSKLRQLFPQTHFRHYSYTYDGQPFYHSDSVLLARFWQFVFWVRWTRIDDAHPSTVVRVAFLQTRRGRCI